MGEQEQNVGMPSPERLGCVSIDTLLRELHGAVEDVAEVVERQGGNLWTSKGHRLVDTPAWRRLHMARSAVNRYEPTTRR